MELLSRHTDCLDAVHHQNLWSYYYGQMEDVMFVDVGAANLKVDCNTGLDKIVII
jgi:hypothetical protein